MWIPIQVGGFLILLIGRYGGGGNRGRSGGNSRYGAGGGYGGRYHSGGYDQGSRGGGRW